MWNQALTLSRETFGDPFVAYALNVEEKDLAALEVSAERADVIRILEHHAMRPVNPRSHNDPSSWLWEKVPPILQSLSSLRHQCGGTPPPFESEDEVEALLLEAVYHVWPALLLPPPEKDSSSLRAGMQFAILGMPINAALGLAIVRDTDFRKIFTDDARFEALDLLEESKKLRVHTNLWWRSGQGGTTWVEAIASHLVLHGVTMAGIHDQRTFADAARYASAGLQIARRLAGGRQATVPLMATISNIDLGDDVDEIDTAWGKLFRPTPMSRALLREVGLWHNGSPRETTAVLASEAFDKLVCLQHRWPDVEFEDDHKWWKSYSDETNKAWTEAESMLDKLRFSLLLSSSPDSLIAAVAESASYLNPLARSDARHLNYFVQVFAGRTVITSSIAETVQQWSYRVKDEHPRSLETGMRRLLSAATFRLDPMDGFIDAVMCWENLFGEAQETSFKVCGALAKLLEPNDRLRREALYGELKKLYDTRSKIVHGSPREPTRQSAAEHRDRAVVIALTALRAAYEYPGLIKLGDSSERYKQVLLEFPH
ncbi:hypothetical protein ACGGAQ_22970 [Micromonospora sp. NPDC047557]|uniref:hypothetical protein n=1 Tax=Micromonospora sp. NPDC047557 TaxID=3364250 RepID=UPI003710CFED